MSRPFETVEEAENLICRKVAIEEVEATLIQVFIGNDNVLYFTFEYEDGTTEILDSNSAFYVVQINGHVFGFQEND